MRRTRGRERSTYRRKRRQVAVPHRVALGVAPLAQVLVVAVELLLVERRLDAVLELARALRVDGQGLLVMEREREKSEGRTVRLTSSSRKVEVRSDLLPHVRHSVP